MILVDTSVVLDLVLNDPNWGPWSLAKLNAMAEDEEFAINDIVYTEVSIGYATIADLDTTIAEWRLKLVPIPRLALFQAGKAYRKYRSRSGTRTGVLPDFFIGAHAMAEGWPLLTRDASRVRTYFPDVELIAPD